MTIKQLQAENEALKAQIAGLSFKLHEVEQKDAMYLEALQSYKTRVNNLEDELRLLRMSNYAAKQYSDDERNY